jgi:hypothetical protein
MTGTGLSPTDAGCDVADTTTAGTRKTTRIAGTRTTTRIEDVERSAGAVFSDGCGGTAE